MTSSRQLVSSGSARAVGCFHLDQRVPGLRFLSEK